MLPTFLYRMLKVERGSMLIISLILLMTVTLYVTFYVESFKTYIQTVDNYRLYDQQQIERRMYELQQNEDGTKHHDLQAP